MNRRETRDASLLARFARQAPRSKSVTALAHEFGVGTNRLRQVLSAATGLTPGAFLERERIASARLLMTRADLPQEEAIRLTGAPRSCDLLAPCTVQTQPAPAVRIFLPAQQPFAHQALANFFGARCMSAVESFTEENGEAAYRRAWRGHGGAGTVTFYLQADGVVMEIDGPGLLPVRNLMRRAERLFDLDAPLDEVAARLGKDPLLAKTFAHEPGRRLPGSWDPFELSVRAILGQQISVAAACKQANRLLALLGVTGPDGHFPTPAELATADLSALPMPAARREAIQTLAAATASGQLNLEAPPAEVHAALLTLRGIGPWTADYISLRGLQDRDAFPAGDLVVRKALAGNQRKLPSDAEARARAEGWRPVRAYAALHLWALRNAGG